MQLELAAKTNDVETPLQLSVRLPKDVPEEMYTF